MAYSIDKFSKNYDNSYDKYIESKEKYNRIYQFFVENKDLDYNSFVIKLTKKMKEENFKLNRGIIQTNEIKNFIEFYGRYHSTARAQNMKEIFYLILSKRFNLDSSVKTLSETIENSNLELPKPISFKPVEKQISENFIDDINNKLKENNEKIKNPQNKIISKVKSNIKNINNDDYILFLNNYFDINGTNKTEIIQFLEVLEFFINNLNNSINTLKTYEKNNDLESIKNFYVKGEEILGNKYLTSIRKLSTWKLNRLYGMLDSYLELYNILKKVVETNNIENLETLDSKYREKIRDDERFVIDYLNDLYSLKRILISHIKTLGVNKERREELEDTFYKKYIFER